MESSTLKENFRKLLAELNAADPEYVPRVVAAALSAAQQFQASDIHWQPEQHRFCMKWRIDSVLQEVAEFPVEVGPRIIARLKVLAGLLTYQTETPQEGRIRRDGDGVEIRVSTMPTLFGEKAVVRLFVGSGRYRRIDELGFPAAIEERIGGLLAETAGVVLLTGPAGSGKTTTVYAALREILDKSGGGRSLVSLEDPIEVVVPGVAQSQVNQAGGFDMTTGLRALLRQDPEVLMVGEIRDRDTVETVFQASLTGHLVLTTFHAGSVAQAVNRLADMGIEPYLLRSGLLAIVCQRLLRELCSCAAEIPAGELSADSPVDSAKRSVGCPACAGTGYQGRFLIGEMISPGSHQSELAVLSRKERRWLEQQASEAGMVSLREYAWQAVAEGRTSPQEVFRVLGSHAL